MARKKRTQTPEYQWEQALIDAYYDYRWLEVLEPLYQKFQQWKAGELDPAELDKAIHETQKQRREVYNLFFKGRDWLVRLIQWDKTWFQAWVKDNPPPEGYQLR